MRSSKKRIDANSAAGECSRKGKGSRSFGAPNPGKATTLGQPRPEAAVTGSHNQREPAVADDSQQTPLVRKLLYLARKSKARNENAHALPPPDADEKTLAEIENLNLWRDAMQKAFGSSDLEVQTRIYHQLIEATGHARQEDWKSKDALVTMLYEVGPGDLQGSFAAVQNISLYEYIMRILARMADPNLPAELAETYANILAKLSRVQLNWSDFLDRHRAQGKEQGKAGEAHPDGTAESVVRYTEQRTVEHHEKRKRF